VIRSKVLRSRMRSQVFVTTHEGATFSGVLWEADDKVLVLRNAEALKAGPDATNLPLDGEVVLLMFDVAFIQRP
jgi:small nuclear ribonucleoprotein (snRNP)-like protein